MNIQPPPLVKIVVKPPQLNAKRLEEFLKAGEILLVGGDEVDWIRMGYYSIEYNLLLAILQIPNASIAWKVPLLAVNIQTP